MILPRSVIRIINKEFSLISHSVSGGMDSLYSLLQLLDDPYLRVPIEPQFINTGVNMKTAKKTIEKINRLTPGNDLLKNVRVLQFDSRSQLSSRYYDWKPIQIVKDSFRYIPKAEALLLKGKYSKKIFPCCYYLKEKPLKDFAKSTPIDTLFTTSIRGGESQQRQFTLSRYRREKRYLNFNVKLQRWVLYPLRDVNFAEVQNYLLNHKDFWNTKHSGCVICPVRHLFNID